MNKLFIYVYIINIKINFYIKKYIIFIFQFDLI